MDLRVARRYARALFEAARNQDSIREADEDLDAIKGILESKPELKEFLESPKVAREKKLDMVDKLFADRARPVTMRLLRLLVTKRRERELSAVREEFLRLKEEAAGTLRISITSALPLSEEQKGAIVSRIALQTGKTVLPQTHVDSSLIGGVRVQYGYSVLDGSVSGALKRLKERLYIDVLKQA
jgi:F-type H+-transporting ATPase subunit delta